MKKLCHDTYQRRRDEISSFLLCTTTSIRFGDEKMIHIGALSQIKMSTPELWADLGRYLSRVSESTRSLIYWVAQWCQSWGYNDLLTNTILLTMVGTTNHTAYFRSSQFYKLNGYKSVLDRFHKVNDQLFFEVKAQHQKYLIHGKVNFSLQFYRDDWFDECTDDDFRLINDAIHHALKYGQSGTIDWLTLKKPEPFEKLNLVNFCRYVVILDVLGVYHDFEGDNKFDKDKLLKRRKEVWKACEEYVKLMTNIDLFELNRQSANCSLDPKIQLQNNSSNSP